MNKIILSLVLLSPMAALQFCSSSYSGNNKAAAIHSLTSKTIVMELFTSQGCSSCPAADRLLGKYANDPSVIALSFHVDYWNNLGWKDPFSSAANSERQKQYAKALALDGVYTPQLVINGEREMVGSDENKIGSAIESLANETSNTSMEISNLSFKESKISVQFTIQSLPGNASVYALVVQKKGVTSVKAGENRGVTITNYNIVRSLTTINAGNGANDAILSLPVGISAQEVSIVLLAQDSSAKIIAAAKSRI